MNTPSTFLLYCSFLSFLLKHIQIKPPPKKSCFPVLKDINNRGGGGVVLLYIISNVACLDISDDF